MKLKFDQNLPHQKAAWDAVVGLFAGQESCSTPFDMPQPAQWSRSGQSTLSWDSNQQGTANRLVLGQTELLDNLKQVQLKNGLQPSSSLDRSDLHYTVEMETGTGKTYVYLRTVFELNERYGFTKFVVVVPSVAIKEGVNKTLQITREHFEGLYPGAKGYEFFQYNSDRLGEVCRGSIKTDTLIRSYPIHKERLNP